MGFAASQARALMLTARKSDLELQAQFINQHRMYLANATNGFFNMQSKLEPDSPEYKLLEARIKQLQNADKILEMQMKRVDTQREAVMKDLESVDKLVQEGAKSFGLMGRQ